MNETLLDIRGLKKHFTLRGGFLPRKPPVVRAVDDVGIKIMRGETLGLVGESGCGKSTLGRLIMRLEEPTAGSILFAGSDILSCKGRALKGYRRQVQMIFQDPYSSLNPRKTASCTIGEPLRIRALILKPKLIIADEPVSSLDVSIQAQILNLMKRLQKEFDLTYLFIAHDLGVVRHMSDRIAVMYLGKIVELGEGRQICKNPEHPYTRALLSAIPVVDPLQRSKRIILHGEMPSPAAPPSGCTFHTRCPERIEICDSQAPGLKQDGSGHWVACNRARQ